MLPGSVRTSLLSIVCLVTIALGLAGCPCDRSAKVIVLLAGDLSEDGAKSFAASEPVPIKAGEVPLDDIASLKVTVTGISLDYAGPVTASEGEGEGEGESEGEGEGEGEPDDASKAAKVVVFSGEKEVDLRDLTGISELISQAAIAAGHYTKIRIAVQDPKLVLVSDRETTITDIQLTANGHLFVSESFDVPEGQTSLVLLDFQGLHLVETGNGKYVWTPQLRATISVVAADVVVTGTIDTVDAAAGRITVDVGEGSDLVDVDFSGAVIFLPTDTDTPTGAVEDLVTGAAVTVDGTLAVSGLVTANAIHILPPPEAAS